MELDLLRRACEVGVGEAVGWRMGWRRRGALAPLCPHQRLCAASAPLRGSRGTSGPWALRPRLRHTTQHAVFFLQFRITAIYVMLSTCVKSCPRVPLHTRGFAVPVACGGSLYRDLTFLLLYTGDDAAGTPSDRPVRTPDSDPMAC